MPPKMQTRAGADNTNHANSNNNKHSNNSMNNYFRSNNSRKPPHDQTTNDMLETILNRINEQTTEIRELKVQVNDYKSMVKDAVTEEIDSREQHWSTEKESILSRINYLEEREESRLRQEKKNNIVIRGFQFETSNRKVEIRNFFKDNLSLDVGVDEVSTFKTSRGSQLTIVRISSFEDKKLLMQNKGMLDNSAINISSDRTKKEREAQLKLNQLAEKLKKEGKEVSVGYRKLTVDGAVNFLDKYDQLNELKQPRSASLTSPGSQTSKRRSSSKTPVSSPAASVKLSQ